MTVYLWDEEYEKFLLYKYCCTSWRNQRRKSLTPMLIRNKLVHRQKLNCSLSCFFSCSIPHSCLCNLGRISYIREEWPCFFVECPCLQLSKGESNHWKLWLRFDCTLKRENLNDTRPCIIVTPVYQSVLRRKHCFQSSIDLLSYPMVIWEIPTIQKHKLKIIWYGIS